jgi:hypothetical protein
MPEGYSVILAHGCRAKRRSVCAVLSGSEGTRSAETLHLVQDGRKRPSQSFSPVQALLSGFLTRARRAHGNDKQDCAGAEAVSLYCARLNNCQAVSRRLLLRDNTER